MLFWLRSVVARLTFVAIALLLGLIAPIHAGGPACSVAHDVAVPPLTVAASPIADAFLAAYRANGPPVGYAEGRSGSTWRVLAVIVRTSSHSAGASFDANGNTVRSSQGNDAYTTDDRLKQRTRPDGSVVSIAYDGDGTKITETVGGVTTWFLVDQQNPTGYAQTIEEVRGGAVVRSYLWGQSLAPLAQSGPEGVRFFGTDGHGSVRYLTDASGTVTDSFDYDAYGILVGRTGTTECRFRYCGYEWMEGVGQYYLRARTYNPASGRFSTRDTDEGYARIPLSKNLYAYGWANPLGNIDPSGHFPQLPGWFRSAGLHIPVQILLHFWVGFQAHVAIQNDYRAANGYRFDIYTGISTSTILRGLVESGGEVSTAITAVQL